MKKKITDRTWFTILLLIVFFPVGLFIMWKKKKFNKIARIIITLFLAFLVFAGGDDSQTSDNKIANEQTTADKIEDIDQISEDVANDLVQDDEETKTENQAETNSSTIEKDTTTVSKTITTPQPNIIIIDNKQEENIVTEENKHNKVVEVTPTEVIKEVNKDVYVYNGVSYKIITVDGGNISGHREPNVAVDIGFGDREYWALTNEYGQLTTVIADKIIPQDDSTEPVNSSGRYYSDEAKVPGTERDDLDEGHVIADSLGGVSNAYNITPQNSTLNRYGDQAYMEKVIRDADGAEDFLAIITYPNTTTQIPSNYYYEYILNGNKVIENFDNVNPDEVNKSLNEKQSDEKKSNEKVADKKSYESTVEKHDISLIDKNGNGKVTIAEAKAAGFKMPIYSDHWLYQYMDDRDGDGVVGE